MTRRFRTTRAAAPGRARRRAMALIEIIVVLITAATIMLMAGWIFTAAMDVQHQAVVSEKVHSQWRDACDLLRQDAWNATAINLIDAQTVELAGADGRVVRWQRRIEDPGPAERNVLSRLVRRGGEVGAEAEAEAEAGRSWTQHAWTGVFAVEGPVLVVKIPADRHLPANELRFVSQILLTRGGER